MTDSLDQNITDLLYQLQNDGGLLENLLDFDQSEGDALDIVEGWIGAVEGMLEAMRNPSCPMGESLVYIRGKLSTTVMNLRLQREARKAEANGSFD
jgi:hypothetical protein